jgi:hypothetical protein
MVEGVYVYMSPKHMHLMLLRFSLSSVKKITRTISEEAVEKMLTLMIFLRVAKEKSSILFGGEMG